MEPNFLSTMIAGIECADSAALDMLADAVEGRYKQLFPEWEVMFLSLPKNDPEERKRILKLAVDILENHP